MSLLEETSELCIPLTGSVDLHALIEEFASALSQRFEIVQSEASAVTATNKSWNALVFRGNGAVSGPADLHPLLVFDRVSIDLSESENNLLIRYHLSTRVQALIYGIGTPIMALGAYATGSLGGGLMALGTGLTAWFLSLLVFNPRGAEWISETAQAALRPNGSEAAPVAI